MAGNQFGKGIPLVSGSTGRSSSPGTGSTAEGTSDGTSVCADSAGAASGCAAESWTGVFVESFASLRRVM